MTKKLFFLFILSVFSFAVMAQDCVTCKIQYQPNMKYSMLSKNTFVIVMKYDAPQNMMDKLRANGYTNPSTIEDKQEMNMIATTGALSDAKTFPVSIAILDMKDYKKKNDVAEENKKDDPMNVKLYGVCAVDGTPKLDSVAGDNMTATLKNTILSLYANLVDASSFPTKCLKPGETFTKESPMEIPMAGVAPIKMKILSEYTFVKMDGKLAVLDLKQNYVMTSDSEKFKVEATGSGTGNLTIDTENNYQVNNAVKMELSVKIVAGELTMNMTETGNSVQTSTVSKN